MCVTGRWAVFSIVIFAKMSRIHRLEFLVLFGVGVIVSLPWVLTVIVR